MRHDKQKIFVVQNKLTQLFWMLNPLGPEFKFTSKLPHAIQFSTYEKALDAIGKATDLFDIRQFNCSLVSLEDMKKDMQ